MYPYTPPSSQTDVYECPKQGDISYHYPSIYCSPIASPTPGTIDPANGCNINTCDDCKISFSTTLDTINNNDITYYVTASVIPNAGPATYYLDVASSGSFSTAGRQIEITIPY
jgi:hypothetical protein